MNIETIKQILNGYDGIDAWRLFVRRVTRKNIYVVKGFEVEDILQAKRFDVSVKVYKYYEDGMMGDYEFPLVTDDKEQLCKQLDDAVFACSLSKKQKYTLPENQTVTVCPELWDEAIANLDEEKLVAKVADFKTELAKYENVMLNSMELHTNDVEAQVINSKGVDLKTKKTTVFVEFIISAANGEKEQEFIGDARFSHLDHLDVAGFVEEKVHIVKDVLQSGKPHTFKGHIIISGDAIASFFTPHLSLGPIALHCSARLAHMDLTRYRPGKALGEFRGDRLTLRTNPFLDRNPSSSLFDGDGVVSVPTTLIENGVFSNYIASKQYSDYMKIAATGSIGVLSVVSGDLSEVQLREGEYVEIVNFASFVPDSISGAFSAEVRLGYFVKDGVKTPFRGGMFTGNVFDLILNCHYSSDRIEIDGYVGPKIVRFNDGHIAGLQ